MTALTGTITDVTDGSRVIQQGLMPYRITLMDTCEVGDLIGYDADTPGWYKADAGEKRYVECVAGERCQKSGDTVTVFRQAIVSGLSDGVAGDPVYCGNTTAGAYEDIPDSYAYQQPVGFCLSTTEVLLCPNAAGPVFSCNREARGYGAWIRSEVDSATATDMGGGLRVEYKALAGATTTEIYGVFVFMQNQDTNCHAGAFLRLEDGCSAGCHPDAFIVCIAGAVGPDNFLDIGNTLTPTGGAWSTAANAPSGAGGWLKVTTGAGARYISLFTGSGA